MNFPQTEYTFLLLGLLFISLILIALFYNSMSSLKREEAKKTACIIEKIQQERKRAKQMINQVSEMNFVEQSIDENLFKIRVELINIDFTIKEICKFI